MEKKVSEKNRIDKRKDLLEKTAGDYTIKHIRQEEKEMTRKNNERGKRIMNRKIQLIASKDPSISLNTTVLLENIKMLKITKGTSLLSA